MRTCALVACLTLSASLMGADYYVSPTGNDAHAGTSANPWKSINTALTRVAAGDVLHLKDGATFTESIYIHAGAGGKGTAANPIRITSSGTNRAVVQAPNADSMALYIYNVGGLVVENLRFVGQGMDLNQRDGVGAYADNNRYSGLTFRNCEVSGFGKTGMYVGGWNTATVGFNNVLIEDCEFHDNRTTGLSLWAQAASGNTNIVARRCKAYNNLGDPAATKHTGSGIVFGGVTDGLIEHCIAYNNGERCTTTGGPVGIWAYDSTRVIIQHCEAYENHAVNCDGGGFDLDGGCQDCVIQYCYSRDNDGAGFLICQYSGARAFTNNIVRYNVSQNDGRRNGFAGIHFYSSGSNGGLQNTKVGSPGTELEFAL